MDERKNFRLTPLLTRREVEAATKAELTQDAGSPKVTLGVTVEPGSVSVGTVSLWKGDRLVGVEVRQFPKSDDIVAWVRDLIRELNAEQVILGEHFHLEPVQEELADEQVRITQLDLSEPSPDGTYESLGAAKAICLRDDVRAGRVALPKDEVLLSELLALRCGTTEEGRVWMEDLIETARRLGRAPRLAIAALVAFPA